MTELHPTLDLAEELQAATHSKVDRAKTFQRFVGGGEIKFRRPPDQFTFVVSVSWKPTSRPTRQRGDVRQPWGIVIFFGSGLSQGLAPDREIGLDGRFRRDFKHDNAVQPHWPHECQPLQHHRCPSRSTDPNIRIRRVQRKYLAGPLRCTGSGAIERG